jgi:putative DNA primase/helicase
VDDEGKAIYLEEVDSNGNKPRAAHTEYYVMPETFKGEVCAGFDYRVVCKLLVKRGCLMVEGKSFQRKERLPGGEGTAYCFRITHKLFEGCGDE